MRATLILVAAIMFGLAGGYAWATLSRPPRHVHVPKVPKPVKPVVIQSAADKQWQDRADENEAAANTAAAAAPSANAAD